MGTGTAGAAGTAAGPGSVVASCSDVAACGGNVIGTWTVGSSCLAVSGNLDVSGFGLGCTSMPVTGSLQVTGTWTANSDGTYSDNTSTSGNQQITVPAVCLNVSGTTTTCDRIGGPLSGLGYASINCTNAAGGGCTCAADLQQTGGIGLASADPQTSGNYSTADNVVTVDSAQYSYCVSGDQMTWSPRSTGAITTGTIVLQKAGTGAVSGSAGSEGTPVVGGIVGAAGSPGSVGSGGASAGGAAGAPATPPSTGTGPGPCDLYAAGGTPCAAAYSPVRLLSSTYGGPLYQVRKGGSNTGTGGTLLDIGVVAGTGFGDGAAQDAFCGADTCTVSRLYDQSGRGNDLTVAPAGCYVGNDPNNPDSASRPDVESNAKGRSLMVGGHKVYALYTNVGEGYRNNAPTGMPMDVAPQGVYMVADGKRYGGACCWDFGNASKDNCYGTTGIMDALFLGTGYWGRGAGNGPWFMADFEGGVWAGGSGANNAVNNNLPTSNQDYAFGLLKTTSTNYAIRVGNAQSGGLTTAYDGMTPKTLRRNGAIILGIGGDNSNHSLGTFFEGAITAGRPSDETDAAVLQNVQAQGYGI